MRLDSLRSKRQLRLMQLMQLQHIRRPTMFLTAAYATYLDLLGNPSTGGPNDSGDDDIPDEPDEALVTSALCPICLTPSGYFQLPDSFVCSKCGFGSMSPLESEKPVPMPVPMMGKADESAGLSEEEMPTESLAASPVKDFPDIAPATTLADAGKVSEQAWNESVTPIPDEILAGDPRGVPLLLGGADLERGSATIMSYVDPGKGPIHEVLFCTVNEAAEQKLLEALAPTEQKLIPKKVVKTIVGRVGYDEEEQIFEGLVQAAKSVNNHLKAQDGIPTHTVTLIANLETKIGSALSPYVGPDGEYAKNTPPELKGMVDKYAPLVEELKKRLSPTFHVPYAEGGRMPQVTSFTTTWDKEEIEYVPDLSELTGEAKLAASARQASRVDPRIVDGKSIWDGKKRDAGQGTEYVIQLPDGYQAIYHPYVYHNQELSQDHFSLRGQLELHCPGGPGHAKPLVDILGSLNIVNRPMNGAEAEWTYLQQNISAQGLGKNSAIVKAIESSADLEANVAQQLMVEHAHEAIGLSEKEVEALAQRLTLEAEASALPLRVRLVRNALAKAVGFASGQELAKDPSYQPMPRRSGGWMVFDRFDVDRNRKQYAAAFANKSIGVSITGTSKEGATLLDVFRNGGVLASTERRRIMGARKSAGMSEASDMQSGGAKSTFVRLCHKGGSGFQVVWNDPLTLLRRSDWYGASTDTFGSENAKSGHSASHRTTDLMKVVTFDGSNEIMFRDGLDLLGADAPSKIICSNTTQRNEILAILKQQGIKELGGKPVTEVFTVH